MFLLWEHAIKHTSKTSPQQENTCRIYYMLKLASISRKVFDYLINSFNCLFLGLPVVSLLYQIFNLPEVYFCPCWEGRIILIFPKWLSIYFILFSLRKPHEVLKYFISLIKLKWKLQEHKMANKRQVLSMVSSC